MKNAQLKTMQAGFIVALLLAFTVFALNETNSSNESEIPPMEELFNNSTPENGTNETELLDPPIVDENETNNETEYIEVELDENETNESEELEFELDELNESNTTEPESPVNEPASPVENFDGPWDSIVTENDPIPYCDDISCITTIVAETTVEHTEFGAKRIIQTEQDADYPCTLEADGSIFCPELTPHGQDSLENQYDISSGIPFTDYRMLTYDLQEGRANGYRREFINPFTDQRIPLHIEKNGVFVVGFASNVFVVTDFTFGSCSDCTATSSGVTLANTHPSLDSNMVLWLPFTSGASDASNFANHGTFQGNVALNQSWADGFNATSASRATVNDANSLDTQNTTVAFWVKFNSLGENQTIIHHEASGGGSGFNCYLRNYATLGIRCYLRNTTTAISYVETGGISSNQNPDIATGRWYSVIFTYNRSNGNMSIYLDGTIKHSIIATGMNLSSTDQVKIGAGHNNPLNGAVDEIIIYNKTLTTSEITSLYNTGLFVTGTSYGNYSSAIVDLGETSTPETLSWSSTGATSYENVTFYARSGEYAKPDSYTYLWTLNQSDQGNSSDDTYAGTAVNGLTYGTEEGPFQGEYSTYFDGTNDYSNYSTNSLNFQANHTVIAWVNPAYLNGLSSQLLTVVDHNKDGSNKDFSLFVTGAGKIMWRGYNGAGSQIDRTSVTAPLTAGKWNQIAAVLDRTGGDVALYVNGQNVSVDNSDISTTVKFGTANMHIGSERGTGNYFNGSIAYVSFVNRTLLPSELMSWGSWSSLLTTSGGSDLSSLSDGRFVELQGILSTNNTASTPWLSSYSVTASADACSGDSLDDASGFGHVTTAYQATYNTGYASFDGVNDYLNTSFNTSELGNNFTISIWVKSLTDGIQTSFFTADGGGADRFYLRQGAQGPKNVTVGIGSWNIEYAYANALTNWTHFVIVVNGTNGYFYRNNVSFGNATSITQSNPNKLIRIGRNEDLSLFLNGSIDDFRVYDRALSVSEVSQLYANNTLSTGLEFWLPFEATCNDSSYSLSYDANGNLIQDANYYYAYNNFNQLVQVRNENSGGYVIAAYVYDAAGQRVKKTEYNSVGVITKTTYYIGTEFVREVSTSSTNDTVYVYAADQLVAEQKGSNILYHHPNHLGSTDITTNQAGTLNETSKTEPYGATISGGSGRFVFTGQERDKEISLDYFDARYYDYNRGLFIQPDPVMQNPFNPQMISRYAYVANNPLTNTDPTGMVIEGEAVEASFGIAGGSVQFVGGVAMLAAATGATGGTALLIIIPAVLIAGYGGATVVDSERDLSAAVDDDYSHFETDPGGPISEGLYNVAGEDGAKIGNVLDLAASFAGGGGAKAGGQLVTSETGQFLDILGGIFNIISTTSNLLDGDLGCTNGCGPMEDDPPPPPPQQPTQVEVPPNIKAPGNKPPSDDN